MHISRDPVDVDLDRYLDQQDRLIALYDRLERPSLDEYYERATLDPDIIEEALTNGDLVDPKPFRNACGALDRDALRKAEQAHLRLIGAAVRKGDEAELGRLLYPMFERYFKDHAEYMFEKHGVPDALLGGDS